MTRHPIAAPSHHRRALLLAVVVTFLWSSSWVLIRVGLDDESLPPISFAGLRYGLAAAMLWTWLGATPARRSVRSLDAGAMAAIAGLGAVFYALTQGAQFIAIDNQPAATTSVVLSMTPLAVGLLGGVMIAEAPTTQQVVGGVLVTVGAITFFAGDLAATAVGMAAALVGLAANTVSAVIGRSVNRRGDHSPLAVTAISMSIGATVLLVTGAIVEGLPRLSTNALLLIVWLAGVNTALAFTMWNASLRHLSAVESAGINNLMLIQIGLLAWLFLDEAPGVVGFTGMVLVSLGVFLTQSRAPGSPAAGR